MRVVPIRRPSLDAVSTIRPACSGFGRTITRHSPAVDVEEDRPARVARWNGQLPPVPANARTREPAHAAHRTVGDEWSGDRPIVWQVHALPRAVIKVGTHVGEVAAPIGIGPREPPRRILDEGVARRQDPRLEHRLRKADGVAGRISSCEPPVSVDRQALARGALRGQRARDREECREPCQSTAASARQ